MPLRGSTILLSAQLLSSCSLLDVQVIGMTESCLEECRVGYFGCFLLGGLVCLCISCVCALDCFFWFCLHICKWLDLQLQ